MFRVTFNNGESFNVAFSGDSNFSAAFANMLFIPEHTYNIGSGLKYDSETDTLSVDAVDDAIDGESRPITSNGVYKEIGNIAVILSII